MVFNFPLMKKVRLLLTALVCAGVLGPSWAQNCEVTVPGGDQNFFSFCGVSGPPGTVSGDYYIKINNGRTLTLNGDLTITGTLTIELVGSTSTFTVSAGSDLVVNNLTFAGSATGKQFVVNGTVDVTGTLDFGGLTIDLDGSGSIDAGTVTGGGNTTCASDSNCPDVSADDCSGGGICSEGCPTNCTLPVELIAFDAFFKNDEVGLSWTTASQLNFSHFDVQRSGNGRDWETVVSIAGEGTTSESNSYTYSDNASWVGKNYYRLSMVDLDGTIEFSPVKMVISSAVAAIIISPNPAPENGKVNYHLNFQPEEGSLLIFSDNLGNELYRMPVTAATQEFTLPTALRSGSHIVLYQSNTLRKSTRIVIR